MPFAVAGGSKIYYEVAGDGFPLVLIPGLSAGAWLWERQVPAFAEHFRAVTFDPRGIGKSEKPEIAYTIPQMADDVTGLLDALGVGRAHVLGTSFGGFVAQELAIRHPARVAGLILCSTSYGGPGHVAPRPEVLQAMVAAPEADATARIRHNLLFGFNPEYIETHGAEVERVVKSRLNSHVPDYVYAGQIKAALGFAAEDRVSAIASPTLVLTGGRDRVVPRENSDNLARAIPGARLRVIEGGSHLFFIEQPAAFNAAVIEFLTGIEEHRKPEN